MCPLPACLQSARGGSFIQGMPQRAPSLPGQPRPYVGAMAPPPGAYEEELHTARSTRSQQQ